MYGFLKKKLYGLYGLFFENCTDCTDFFWKCTDFCTDGFKKVLATLQILYFFTGSSAQTIAMYTTIVFMYGRCYSANYRNVLNHVFMYRRCYSANYRHVLNHVFIYVHDVLQRKPSLYTLKLYLFTRSTAQTLAIVFMYRRCYSAKYHYVPKLCIYVQEVLQRKISLCT